jgi:fumarylpyruvate hydrolase
MTSAGISGEVQDKGQPWGWPRASIIGTRIGTILGGALWQSVTGAIWLSVDGVDRQQGDLAQMTWNVEVIAHLSAYLALAPGDLIFTGTPSGVVPGAREPGALRHRGIGELEIVLV